MLKISQAQFILIKTMRWIMNGVCSRAHIFETTWKRYNTYAYVSQKKRCVYVYCIHCIVHCTSRMLWETNTLTDTKRNGWMRVAGKAKFHKRTVPRKVIEKGKPFIWKRKIKFLIKEGWKVLIKIYWWLDGIESLKILSKKDMFRAIKPHILTLLGIYFVNLGPCVTLIYNVYKCSGVVCIDIFNSLALCTPTIAECRELSPHRKTLLDTHIKRFNCEWRSITGYK